MKCDLPRADARCCLSDLGSINTPRCIVADQKKAMETVGQKAMESQPGDCAGKSIVEMLEDLLDGLVGWLKTADPETTPDAELQEMKGRAAGVADCIAVIQNPYYPNVIQVKAAAVRRYEYRLEQDEKRAAKTAEALPLEQ